MIQHHTNCRPNYPEKPRHEPPQFVSRSWTDDGFWIDTCHDCGAFDTNLPDADDPYWDEAKAALREMEES